MSSRKPELLKEEMMSDLALISFVLYCLLLVSVYLFLSNQGVMRQITAVVQDEIPSVG